MYDDIIDQPKAIAEILPDLRSQLKPQLNNSSEYKRIILTGSGDSYYGPISLQQLFLRHVEPPVYPIHAMNAAAYWDFFPGDLLIAISFSGKAHRTLKAVKEAKKKNALVCAITGDDQSELAKMSDYAVQIKWHSPSRSIPHTVDYLTILVAIACIIERLSGKRFDMLDNLSEMIAHTIQHTIESTKEIGKAFEQREVFYLLGAGPNYGNAQYGAEKFWEACGMLAYSFEMEEFAHGPHKLIEEGDPLILLAPDEESSRLSSSIAKGVKLLGADPVVVTDRTEYFTDTPILQIPSVEKAWTPFIVPIPQQLLTYSVATAKGYDVQVGEGRVENIKKLREIQKVWIR